MPLHQHISLYHGAHQTRAVPEYDFSEGWTNMTVLLHTPSILNFGYENSTLLRLQLLRE